MSTTAYPLVKFLAYLHECSSPHTICQQWRIMQAPKEIDNLERGNQLGGRPETHLACASFAINKTSTWEIFANDALVKSRPHLSSPVCVGGRPETHVHCSDMSCRTWGSWAAARREPSDQKPTTHSPLVAKVGWEWERETRKTTVLL